MYANNYDCHAIILDIVVSLFRKKILIPTNDNKHTTHSYYITNAECAVNIN